MWCSVINNTTHRIIGNVVSQIYCSPGVIVYNTTAEDHKVERLNGAL